MKSFNGLGLGFGFQFRIRKSDFRFQRGLFNISDNPDCIYVCNAHCAYIIFLCGTLCETRIIYNDETSSEEHFTGNTRAEFDVLRSLSITIETYLIIHICNILQYNTL